MSDERGNGREFSRRRFLIYSAASGGVALLPDAFALRALAQVGQGQGLPLGAATFTRVARRREDFLSLVFSFHNLKLDKATPRRLVKVVAKQPAFMVVSFPPQHLSDESKKVTDLQSEGSFNVPGEIRARLAGRSRLAFLIPDGRLPMPFNFASLLNWVVLTNRIVPAAANSSPPATLVAPSEAETAIELPWHLILSPLSSAGWAHAPEPVVHGGRAELWHTRLGTRTIANTVDEDNEQQRLVRAVWTLDQGFPAKPPAEPSSSPTLSLTADDRWQIAGLSSLVANRRPVRVNRLMLSALGGWLDAHGEWDPPEGYSLEDWRHRAAMGRDTYVRTVKRGFLMPFGHRAVRVDIDERQFRKVGNNPVAAYLVNRSLIIVREPFKEFGQEKAKHQPKDGRGFPFRSVRIRTLVTPDLAAPNPPETELKFLVRAEDGSDVLFDCAGVDWEGQPTEFQSRMVYVDQSVAFGQQNSLINLYNGLSKPRRSQPTAGQKVALAPATEGGETSFSVEELVFKAQSLAGGLTNQVRQELESLGLPPFYPLLEEATVHLSAVAAAAGDLLAPARVAIDQAFVDFGLPGMPLPDFADEAEAAAGHAGQLFLGLLDDASEVVFGDADKAGGIATPNFGIAGLSRLVGPVGGVLDDLRKGTFDPKTFFDEGAKLLGSLKLSDVIAKVTGPKSLGEKGPKLQTILLPKGATLPEKIITRLDWKPDLAALDEGDPTGIFEAIPGESSLTLLAEATTDVMNPSASTFRVEGLLRNVKLHLIGANAFLIIEVKQVKFTAAKDKPLDVDPQIGNIEFSGPLKFVEELRNFLSSLGKGYGVTVQPWGIEAEISLPLPTVGVGVFTMQNISIGLGAKIPFTGDPARFRFAFCSRENPFILTVAMFGGGGFFAIECGTDKSIMLELSLEFGAAVAFDIGVASGGAEIMAGIYIKVENDDALLSGFLRAAGELDILSLIRISCEIYLGFEYHSKSDKCVGEARFYLEIEIFGFITIPVKAQVRRAFGGEKDPTFAQLMSKPDWETYCNAYAPLVTP